MLLTGTITRTVLPGAGLNFKTRRCESPDSHVSQGVSCPGCSTECAHLLAFNLYNDGRVSTAIMNSMEGSEGDAYDANKELV